jgi:VWFA-related protein
MRRSLLPVAVSLLLPLTSLAQKAAENIDVRVINVNVSVVDGGGKVVTDLTKDDFELFEDNQPQTITNFVFVDRPARSSGAPRAANDLQVRRRTILLVDNNYIDKQDRDLALRKLDEFIDGTYDGSYEWSLGVIGQQLEIVQPFTTEPAAIHEAVKKIRKTATTSYRDIMDRSMLDDPLYQRSGMQQQAGFEGRERTTRNQRSLTNTARGLIDAARAFALIDGPKAAVLLTGSMDLATSFAAFERAGDRELKDTKLATAKLIDAIVREANAADMSIHVVRASSHMSAIPQHDVLNRSSGKGIEGLNISAPTDVSDTSTGYTLAAGTGGLYLASNALRQSLDTVDAATGAFYLLGYQPKHPEDRQFHRISVRVKRPGVRLTHRQGYLDLSADERLEQLLRLRISTMQPAKAVPVTMNVGTQPGPDGKPIVSVLAAMPMTKVTLLPREEKFAGKVHVYLSIFDAKGNNVGFHHKTQDLAFTPAQREQVLAEAFRYRLNVRLDRGEFTIAVTLRDHLSNEVGTAIQKVRL